MASKKTDKEIINAYVKRALRVNGAIDTFANGINSTTKEFHKNLIDKISKDLDGKLSSKRINEIAKEVEKTVKDFYETEINPQVDEGVKILAGNEFEWNNKHLTTVTGDAAKKYYNSEKVAKRAMAKTYQGHTFKYWFDAASDTEWLRTSKILKAGYVEGKSTPDIVREVQKVLNRADADVKTLTRSYLQHAAAEARYDSFASFETVTGFVWNSTLDSRTTPHICGVRDGLKYDLNHQPIGHAEEWGGGPGRIHFNCRSSPLPLLRDSPNLADEYARPAIDAGADYERGDNKLKNGKVRKPTKGNIEKGIYDVKQVAAGTKYEGWLKSQKTDYVADILGSKEEAVKFKKGEINLSEISKKTNLKLENL